MLCVVLSLLLLLFGFLALLFLLHWQDAAWERDVYLDSRNYNAEQRNDLQMHLDMERRETQQLKNKIAALLKS